MFLIITVFRSLAASTCLCASTMTHTAVSPSVVLTLARTAPYHSKNLTNRLDSPLGAIVPAKQASRPTLTMTPIVAQENMTAPQPVRPQAFSIILISNQIAQIRMRMFLMGRVGRQLSRAPHISRRLTTLRSAPKIIIIGKALRVIPRLDVRV